MSLRDTSNFSSIANSNGSKSPSASISNSANELTFTLSASAIFLNCSGLGIFFPNSYLRIATSCIPHASPNSFWVKPRKVHINLIFLPVFIASTSCSCKCNILINDSQH